MFFDELRKKNKDNISNENLLRIETDNIHAYLETEINKAHIDSIKEIEKLKHELYHDELTSVYNKKYFTNKIVGKGGVFQQDGTLVFIDLNKFKSINDTYGHNIGDTALEVFSSFLSSNLRENDKIVRYAGDEFLILFDTNNFDNILTKMKHLSEQLSLILVGVNDNEHINLEFSFGIKPFKKDDCYKNIVKLADEAMYRHKKRLKK